MKAQTHIFLCRENSLAGLPGKSNSSKLAQAQNLQALGSSMLKA